MPSNEVIAGEVTRVEHYGLYVKTSNGDAIVLIPNVSRERIPDLKAVYKAGDSVRVRLVRFVPELGMFVATMIF